MATEEIKLQPGCYQRHAILDAHISGSTFWRGVLVTFIGLFATIAIAQFNLANATAMKMAEANAKLTNMVEINTKRLDRMENCFFVPGGVTLK